MKHTVLTFGVLSGIVAAIFIFATMPFIEQIGFDRGMFVGYTAIVISMLFVYFGIRSYRDNVLGGQISFGRGFQAGILITLISCAFYVAAWLFVYYNFIPDFGEKYAAYLVESTRASGATQAEIDDMARRGADAMQMLKNPFINAAVSFTEPFPVGLLITLISAAMLRTKAP
ncbi:MAG TPA: DUF4199 domain-containing protein [Vicinamibacterales bacterium]|nr:DUF4199 domain-containing protein [Vicinamibacterales bacterium]